ncbi:hypothetical protein [Allocoleopsis sp.]|uniref:hypothetical protein n=1 Tax=Allocoleopsis sp. TaxID=3088169 RepID=UPI002FD0B780
MPRHYWLSCCTRLVLLIAIAYTCACLKGDKTQRSGQQKYVCRLLHLPRKQSLSNKGNGSDRIPG